MIDLELKNITKKFGDFTAVSDFSLQVEKGEFISFLGPSGCGKTTTLRMIAGFIEPTHGEILIQGNRVNGVPPNHRDTGMVFQNYALFPHMTVFENVAFGLKYRDVSKKDIKVRVREILEMVQLPDVENRKPSQLSGGQQQRIALARALVIRPKVLLFDEPLSNLDAKLRESLRVELREIQQEVGITSIFVTHDQEEALALSDRIVVINAGKVTQIDSPRNVYENPGTIFIGDFIGQSNFLNGQIFSIDNDQVRVSLQNGLQIGAAMATEKLAENDSVKVLIRAERIRVSSAPRKNHLEDETNVLKGTIQETSYLGSNIHYYIRLENGDRLMAIEQTAEKKPFRRGDEVFLEFGTKSSRCFQIEMKGPDTP